MRPDVVLQLGGRITSKRTSQFLEWAAQPSESRCIAHPASLLLLDSIKKMTAAPLSLR